MSLPVRFFPDAKDVRARREQTGEGMAQCARHFVVQNVASSIDQVGDPLVADILRALLALATHKV